MTSPRGSRPIRIAHVCSSDLSIPALLPFNRPLVKRGWEVTMIHPDGPHVASCRDEGIAWLPFALERRMDLASDVVGTLQLARYIARERYDIVHTHNIKAGHIGRVVAAAMRVPVVVHTLHGMAYSRDTPPLMRAVHASLERIASLGCDMIMSQSREDRDTLLADHVITEAKIVVIGNGINLTRFDPTSPALTGAREATRRALGIADDEVLFLSAGRLVVMKGFVELIEAFATARSQNPRIRLAIAGPADDKSDALDAATLERARGLGVLLLGSRSDMPQLYAAADVVTLASWAEGLPRTLMEAAAMAKPLLATNVVGSREVVQADRNGLLVPVRNPDALSRAMVTLAADAALRARLAAVNAAEARGRFDIESAVRIATNVYDVLLSAKLGGRG